MCLHYNRLYSLSHEFSLWFLYELGLQHNTNATLYSRNKLRHLLQCPSAMIAHALLLFPVQFSAIGSSTTVCHARHNRLHETVLIWRSKFLLVLRVFKHLATKVV